MLQLMNKNNLIDLKFASTDYIVSQYDDESLKH